MALVIFYRLSVANVLRFDRNLQRRFSTLTRRTDRQHDGITGTIAIARRG